MSGFLGSKSGRPPCSSPQTLRSRSPRVHAQSLRFKLAFLSRSTSFPQDGQIHSLTERGKFLYVVLHVLQVFEDA